MSLDYFDEIYLKFIDIQSNVVARHALAREIEARYPLAPYLRISLPSEEDMHLVRLDALVAL